MNAVLLMGSLVGALIAGAVPRPPADDPKAFVVEQGVNEQSGFMIRVSVDKPDRTYHEGETMTVSIVAERDCYVYLLYYDAEDNIACLLPNEFQPQNSLKAGVEYSVPAKGDTFRFRAKAPFGDELLHVVATLKPLDLFQGKRFTAGRTTPLTFREVKKAMETVQVGQDSDIWAECRVPIKTLPGKAGASPGQQEEPRTIGKLPKRLGVCVGISQFKDPRVPRLRVSDRDAERMAKALQEQCGVSQVTLLTNEQATLEAMRKAIFEDLVRQTKPGDTVFIYFSGHGGRCADTNGDEADGLDEYLVPYDGVLGSPETMLIDDMFARWMQELDGRQVCVVLDNCYSGGSSKGMKGLPGPASTRPVSLDFVDGEMRRAKDLGQRGTEVLAASQADQIAWEMASGDGSTLTYYILQALGEPKTDANQDGHLSVGEVFGAVKDSVSSYVRQTFMTDQTPVLLDNADDKIIFRP